MPGYQGNNGYSESSTSVELPGMKITAQDGNAKEKAYIELGLGVLALIAGGVLPGGRKR